MAATVLTATSADKLVAAALPRHGMSAEEYKRVMAPSKAWPFPGHEDGWVKVHNAIRKDMAEFAKAIDAVLEQLKLGNTVAPWVIDNLQRWWPCFEQNVHHHHDNEELIFFPFVDAKVKLPAKMSADHATLLAQLTYVAGLLEALRPNRTIAEHVEAFTALRDGYNKLHVDMREHLQEEEDVGLPLLRKNFTAKEIKPLERKLQKNSSLSMIGWFLNGFKTDDERNYWLTHVAKIPKVIQALIMIPAANKYRNNVSRLLVEVQQGVADTPKRVGCFKH